MHKNFITKIFSIGFGFIIGVAVINNVEIKANEQETSVSPINEIITTQELNVWSTLYAAFRNDVWNTMDIKQKEAYVDLLVTQLSYDFDLTKKPTIIYSETMHPSVNGTYQFSKNEISINKTKLGMENSFELLRTLVHEIRHAYQDDQRNKNTQLGKQYYNNLINYIHWYDDYDRYRTQLIEADATNYSNYVLTNFLIANHREDLLNLI